MLVAVYSSPTCRKKVRLHYNPTKLCFLTKVNTVRHIEYVYTLTSFATPTTLTRNLNFLTLLLQDGLECVHDLDLWLFSVNVGRIIALMKLLQHALTLLVRDEDLLIWSQVLLEHGLLLLLDSALRLDDLKLLFVRNSACMATRLLICNHSLPYLFLIFVDAFDRSAIVFISPCFLGDFLRIN